MHSNMLECIALHWALTEKFRIYVYGLPVIHVWTDNYSVSLMTNTQHVNRKFARMVLDLQELPIQIHHRSGKENVVADALSRIPEPIVAYLILSAENSHLSLQQQSDPALTKIFEALKDPNVTSRTAQKLRNIFFLSDGILCRKTTDPRGLAKTTIVVPESLRKTVVEKFHDKRGHMDKLKTKSSILSKYWWSSMDKDIKEYIQGCSTCQQFNRLTTRPVGYLHPRPVPSEPFTAISIDHIGPLPETANGNKYILICVDHTTRFVVTQAVKSTATSHIIDFLHEKVNNIFGIPVTLISDQGTGFVSQHMEKFLNSKGIEHKTSCPYFHQANGLVERSVATVKNMIKKYCANNPSKWDKHIANVTSFINAAKQGSTRFSPHFLLFGFEPRAENELEIGTVLPDISRLESLDMLHQIRNEAQTNLQKALLSQKTRYDQDRTHSHFSVGDLVLVESNPTQPFDPKYKDKVFKVVSCHPHDVCLVEGLDDGKARTVHVTQLKKYRNQPNWDPDVDFVASFNTDNSNTEDELPLEFVPPPYINRYGRQIKQRVHPFEFDLI